MTSKCKFYQYGTMKNKTFYLHPFWSSYKSININTLLLSTIVLNKHSPKLQFQKNIRPIPLQFGSRPTAYLRCDIYCMTCIISLAFSG